ncbi:MAG: hypothetical protein ACJAVM_003010 [Sulfitobacter sp.]|jgi:Haem-dependent oxidative N-demethylase, alpha subunit-like
MNEILQDHLPPPQAVENQLPGVGPCESDDWLRVDEAYHAQLAYKAHLLAQKTADVLWLGPKALPAAQEVLEQTLLILPDKGFVVGADHVICPDQRRIRIDFDQPLLTLGHLVQEDICILQKQGDEHVLTGAVLCFPASWRLAEKAGRPLTQIHIPVVEYDANIARRVQRMFDGVRVGKPLWRYNRLGYVDADLHQPRRKSIGDHQGFLRSERQCILRMPKTDAVIFTIHTWVVRKDGRRSKPAPAL